MLLLVLLVSTAVMEYSTGYILGVQPRIIHIYTEHISMTFYPLPPPTNKTFEVEFRIKAVGRKCGRDFNENSTMCIHGDCGKPTYYVTTVTDNSKDMCLQELKTTRILGSNRPFVLSFALDMEPPTSILFTLAKVDLGIRSDTGRPNTSPITTIIDNLRIQPDCPGTFNLTIFDPDGDRIRCNFPSTYPGFTLDQDNCMLWYDLTGMSSQPVLAFDLRLEDFPRKQITLSYSDGAIRLIPTTAVLSSVPLKLYVSVEQQNATSCCTGDFIPLILSPTPPNGAVLPALAGRPLEITVRALFRLSRFHNFLISGPSEISKSIIRQQSVAVFVITWTPSDNEENRHFPICFVVETVNSTNINKIYQSKLRCVIVNVRGPPTTPTPTMASTTDDPAFCRQRPSGYFENPDDPNSFFQCHFGVTYMHHCPAGLVFSPRYVHTYNTPSSRFCEGMPDGHFENEQDSSSYYQCSNQRTFIRQCPGDLVYGDGCEECTLSY